jgi:pimeloyl-ACP methyl ester carboxylesterase
MRPVGFTRRSLRLEAEVMPSLPRITQPTFLCWGLQDRIVGPAAAAEYTTRVPNLEYFECDQCGHVPHVEHAPAFLERMGAFLGRG